jgi:hypothetical protein
MSEGMVRTHVLLPASLVEEVDRRAGARKRSEFIAAAIEQELHRRRLLEAYDAFAGSMDDVAVPGWETHDSTVEWVRAQRRSTSRSHRDKAGGSVR